MHSVPRLEARGITATITFAIGLTKTFEVEHGGRGPGLDRGPTPDRARSRYRDIALVAVIVLVIVTIEEPYRRLLGHGRSLTQEPGPHGGERGEHILRVSDGHIESGERGEGGA